MEAFAEMVTADAKAKVEQIPALVEAHLTLMRENFIMTQEEARANLVASAGDLKAGKSSPAMKALVLKMNDALAQDIEVLASLTQWIALSVPVIEDGNNFGCDVQGHVYETIKKACAVLQGNQDSLASYFSDRAGAMDKVTAFPSKKTSSSSSKSSSTGGKEDEAGEKTSTSESVESSATEAEICEDHLEFVAMVDLKWYNKMKGMLMAMTEAMAVAGDTVSKNLQKIDDPRGDKQGGGGGMGMY
jgi:hypothetical protein